jgi:hypothetical protein
LLTIIYFIASASGHLQYLSFGATEYYSRRGKNWLVMIKKAYKVKEKTIRQKIVD